MSARMTMRAKSAQQKEKQDERENAHVGAIDGHVR